MCFTFLFTCCDEHLYHLFFHVQVESHGRTNMRLMYWHRGAITYISPTPPDKCVGLSLLWASSSRYVPLIASEDTQSNYINFYSLPSSHYLCLLSLLNHFPATTMLSVTLSPYFPSPPTYSYSSDVVSYLLHDSYLM